MRYKVHFDVNVGDGSVAAALEFELPYHDTINIDAHDDPVVASVARTLVEPLPGAFYTYVEAV